MHSVLYVIWPAGIVEVYMVFVEIPELILPWFSNINFILKIYYINVQRFKVLEREQKLRIPND